ncbi:MAG TPA: hypothetical protein VMS93_07200, partial [Candidatus Saccharimonadales bacterium]|nr:hypothetical protein [Candidatus Saccharimonadales bacterium]
YLVQRVVSGAYYVSDERLERFGSRESEGAYPVHCADRVLEHRLRGPLFNTLGAGSYLAQRLGPERRVFIYGQLEVVGEAFFQEYVELLSPAGWDAGERRWGFRLAVLDYGAPELAEHLARDPRWALLEADGAGLLFARVDSATAPLARRAAERWLRLGREGLAAPPLQPRRGLTLAQRLLAPQRYPWETWGCGKCLSSAGLLPAALAQHRRALLEAGRDYPNLCRSYALVNLLLGRGEVARTWYERLLEQVPGDATARRHLEELGGP